MVWSLMRLFNVYNFLLSKVMKKITRQKCEVYSRVVGYIRPVNQWNIGKQAEWSDRKFFKMGCTTC